jgi:hypothetical protein
MQEGRFRSWAMLTFVAFGWTGACARSIPTADAGTDAGVSVVNSRSNAIAGAQSANAGAGSVVSGSRAAATGGSAALKDADAGSECTVPLERSGCPASYPAALAAIECAQPIAQETRVADCGALHTVQFTQVDVGLTCMYDTAGILVRSSECSKPIGGCSCFIGGDTNFQACSIVGLKDACGADAGQN